MTFVNTILSLSKFVYFNENWIVGTNVVMTLHIPRGNNIIYNMALSTV